MADFIRKNPTDDTPLHGRVLASPAKPVAVIGIVHGFGEHVGRYEDVAERLGAEGLAVIGLDLHGHGHTPGPRGYVRRYERFRENVDMLVAEAGARFPDMPLFLWGHSMGGGLVLDYTFDRGAVASEGTRLSGVIATAPLIEAADPPPAPVFALMKLLARIAPKAALKNTITGDQISTLPEEQTRYEADTLNHDRLSLALGLQILGAGKGLAERQEAFPVPLLLIHARGDTLTKFEASERFAAAREGCNFHPLEGVAHEVHNDSSRDEVVRLITDFAREVIQGETA